MRNERQPTAMFETLESRQMMSATVVHVAATPVHKVAAVHVKPHKKHVAQKKQLHAAVAPIPTPVAWNDLVGTWTGTFTANGKGGATGPLSVVFQPRWIESNTGTFNLSSMVGQSGVLSTTTPDSAGNVPVYIPLKNGGSMSFVGGLSYGSKTMVGRWCSLVGTTCTTGTFTMTRP